jgi:hypothetical protein
MENNINAVGAWLETNCSFKKVGGLYHWRIGRVGGSVYIKKARVAKIVTKYKREVEAKVDAPVLQLTGPSADRVSLALARIGRSTNMI